MIIKNYEGSKEQKFYLAETYMLTLNLQGANVLKDITFNLYSRSFENYIFIFIYNVRADEKISLIFDLKIRQEMI